MIKIFVDDVRPTPNDFDYRCNTVSETVSLINKLYKKGNSEILLSLDHDAGDFAANGGGDYINILNRLEDMRHGGHLTHLNLFIHPHSMNVVGVQNMRNIINANSKWMREI
jgi:hypothetical protein